MWANQLIGHPRIIVPAGYYRLSQTGPDEDASATGDLDLTNTLGITRIVGAGPGQTVIDGMKADRVLDVAPSVHLELSDLAIVNGRAETGGGIRVLAGGRLAMSRVRIADNQAALGGGLYAAGVAEVRLNDTTIADNTADQGGGIMTSETDSLSVQRSLLRANRATLAGGAIHSSEDTGPIHILETWIVDNTAGQWGGGIHLDDSQAIVERSTLSGNMSGDRGGGLSAWEDASLTLLSSTLSGNRAQQRRRSVRRRRRGPRINSDPSQHDHRERGRRGRRRQWTGRRSVGGASWRRGRVALFDRGRELCGPPGQRRWARLKPDDIRGSVSWRSDYNLIGVDRQLGLMNGVRGNRLGSIRHPLDPGLGPLADNGGPTPTHDLLPGSPAIDFGRRGAQGRGPGRRPISAACTASWTATATAGRSSMRVPSNTNSPLPSSAISIRITAWMRSTLICSAPPSPRRPRRPRSTCISMVGSIARMSISWCEASCTRTTAMRISMDDLTRPTLYRSSSPASTRIRVRAMPRGPRATGMGTARSPARTCCWRYKRASISSGSAVDVLPQTQRGDTLKPELSSCERRSESCTGISSWGWR